MLHKLSGIIILHGKLLYGVCVAAQEKRNDVGLTSVCYQYLNSVLVAPGSTPGSVLVRATLVYNYMHN